MFNPDFNQHAVFFKDPTAPNGAILMDTRSTSTIASRMLPQDRIRTPDGTPATVIGADARGNVRFQVDGRAGYVCWSQCQDYFDFLRAGFRFSSRNVEPPEFRAVSALYTVSCSGTKLYLDVRPDSTAPLGYLPGDRIRTPFTFATVVGVDRLGCMYVHNDADDFGLVTSTETVTNDKSKGKYMREGYRLANDGDQDFLAHAVGHRDTDGNMTLVDPRPQSVAKHFPRYPPMCRVLTPDDAAIVVGVDANGALFFCHESSGYAVTFYPNCETEAALQARGFHRMATVEDRFLSRVTLCCFPAGNSKIWLDARPQTVEKYTGFRPGDHIKTAETFATVVGVDLGGCLLVRNDCDPTVGGPGLVWSTRLNSKEALLEAGYRLADTAEDQDFLDHATCVSDQHGLRVLIDTRPEACQQRFNIKVGTRVVTPSGQFAKLMGVDANGALRYELITWEDEGRNFILHDRCGLKDEFLSAKIGGYRLMTKKEEMFLSSHESLFLTNEAASEIVIDEQAESFIKTFGFGTGDQIRTPETVAWVEGVNVNGRLLVLDHEDVNDLTSVTPITLANADTWRHDFRRMYRLCEGDEDFLDNAVAFQNTRGRTILVDTRPRTMLARFGYLFPESHLVFPASGVFARAVGVDINGELRFVKDGDDAGKRVLISDAVNCKCKADFERLGFRRSTNSDDAFFAVAVPHSHFPSSSPPDDTISERMRIDVHPDMCARLGFRPGDRVVVGPHGTVLGVNVNGSLVVRVDDEKRLATWEHLTSKEDFAKEGIRLLTRKDIAFRDVAVKFDYHQGLPTYLDVRPEAIQPFGFRPQERVWTKRGYATICGVDAAGRLFFEFDYKKGVNCCPKNDYVELLGLRRLNQPEEDFFSIAVRFSTSMHYEADTGDECLRGWVYLDVRRRPDPTGDFQPGDRLVTPLDVVKIAGVSIDGTVYFSYCVSLSAEEKNTKLEEKKTDVGHAQASEEVVLRGPRRPLNRMPSCRLMRAADEEFLEHASLYLRGDMGRGNTTMYVYLDTRPEFVLRACGFRPQQHVLTSFGFARVIGVSIIGRLFLTIEGLSPPSYSSSSASERVCENQTTFNLRPLTNAEKQFLSVAVLHDMHESTATVLLDTRPDAIHRSFGFRPGECVAPDPPMGETYVVGADVNGTVFFSKSSLGGRVFVDRPSPPSSFVLQCPISAAGAVSPRVIPIFTPPPQGQQRHVTTKQGHKSLSKSGNTTSTAAVPQTVALPCGARYVGLLTKAGLLHGPDGILRSADGCWRFQGMWLRGLPHGSGAMYVKTGHEGSDKGCAVFEGQWACGVPHGPGTLTTADGRRYRGRWRHGRRIMVRGELAAMRLSGGEAVRKLRLGPPPTTATKKGRAAAGGGGGGGASTGILCAHDQTQQMTSLLAAACGDRGSAPGMYQVPPATHIPRGIRSAPQKSKTRTTLRNFLLGI